MIKFLQNKTLFFFVFIVLLVSAVFVWRYFYFYSIDLSPDFEKNIFRPFFRNNLAPFYGLDISSHLNFITLSLNFTLILFLYYWVNKIQSFKLTIIFVLFLIFLLASKESILRIYDTYSHFQTFSDDLKFFKNSGDIFCTYQIKQFSLGIHNGHYPPGQLILLSLFPVVLIKFFLYSLLFPIFFCLDKVALKLNLKKSKFLIFVLIPSLVIFPSLDFVILSGFFFIITLYLLLYKPRYFEYLIGITLTFWIFFNFNIFIGLFFVLLLFLLQKPSWKEFLLILLKAGAIPIFTYLFLYFIFNFSIVKIFLQAVNQNQYLLNGNPFNSLLQYFLISIGNILNYILGFGPLFFVIFYQAFVIKNKIAITLIFTILILSFSGLFFMETDRVWYFISFLAVILIDDFFFSLSKLSSWFLIIISLLYVLIVEMFLVQ